MMHIQLYEVHIVEHVDGDSTKFGLRKGSMPHTEMLTVLKANNQATRIQWVKALRELMHDMKKLSIGKSFTKFRDG